MIRVIMVVSLLVFIVSGIIGCGVQQPKGSVGQTVVQPTTPEDTIKAMVQAANCKDQSQADKFFPGITENIMKKVSDDGKVKDIQILSKAKDTSQIVGQLYRVKINYSDATSEQFDMQVQKKGNSWIINEVE